MWSSVKTMVISNQVWSIIYKIPPRKQQDQVLGQNPWRDQRRRWRLQHRLQVFRKSICLIYLNCCRWLIRSDSQEHYNIRLINTVQRWSPAFQQYYMTNINTDVHLYSDWLAKKIKFPTTKDSIFTSNGCEHINFMVKFLQDFKEVIEQGNVSCILSSSLSRHIKKQTFVIIFLQ